MLTTSKLGANFECCMCGDCGLSYELFRCKVCQFRSQHRYCSNLYPNAQSYEVCNWCLIQKEGEGSPSNNSSNSSSPALKSTSHQGHTSIKSNMTTSTTAAVYNTSVPLTMKKKKNSYDDHNYSSSSSSMNGPGTITTKKKGQQNSKLRPPGSPIKKQRSPDALSSPSSRVRRITLVNNNHGGGRGEKDAGVKPMMRRTESEGMSSSNFTSFTRPHVFKNKVRRYKLLEEVSS